MTPEDMDRARSDLYDLVSRDPGSPQADQARRILAKMKKIKVGQGFEQPGLPKEIVHGQLSGADLGAETLPPTPDEMVAGGQQERRTVRQLSQGTIEAPMGARAATALLNPSMRHQFERGLSDMVTFGLAEKAANKVDKEFEGSAAEDQRAHPDARLAGQVTGAFMPGAARTAGKLGGATAELMVGPGKGLGRSLLSGATRGAIANEIAMPTIAGGIAAVRGEDPIDAAREEALNPINSIAGALLGFPSGLSRGIRQTGQTGRDIRLAEEYRATPTPFGGAKGGAYESSPLLREAEGTAGEQGQASRRAAEHVMNTLDKERAGLQEQYGTDKAAARDQGFLEGRISTDAVRQEAQKLLSGMGLTSSERSAIQREVLDELDKHPGGMTVDDFNDFRGKLGRIFGVGPGETAVPAIDVLRRSAKSSIDQTEMGPINERYAKGREALSRKHEQLGVSEGGRREIQERRIANVIQRRANDEAPGAGINEAGDLGIAQFLAENPHLKAPFDTARLLATKERMSAGIEPQGGFFRRVGKHGLLEKNLEPALVGLYRLGAPADRLAIPAALAARFYLQGGQP